MRLGVILKNGVLWFDTAAYHTQPAIDVRRGGKLSLLALEECYRSLKEQAQDEEEKQYYQNMEKQCKEEADQWEMPLMAE